MTKVHLEAIRFAREGYTILLIGHEGHDEVLGTMGEAPDHIRLVQDEARGRARSTCPTDAKVAYLTQTTLSVDDAEIIIAALRALPAHRRPVEGRHLLRDAEPAGGGQGPGARGRRR